MATTRRGAGYDERGFTFIEVIAAIVILLIGVLGVVALATGANQTTTRTKAREAGNGLARDLVEAVQGIPYAQLTRSTLTGRLQGQSGLADASAAAGWQIQRRGVTYTVSASMCVVDDAKDGMGARDESFCTDLAAAGTADRSPSDYKRVTIALEWSRGNGLERLSQTTLIANTDRGPEVTALDTHPAGGSVVTSGTQVTFRGTTAIEPPKLEWYVDGAYQQDLTGGISGSGTGPYTFTWNVGPACSTTSGVIDGTYMVGLQGFNSSGGSPGPRTLTVTLNRCAPFAPTSFAAGRNTWGVELGWEANREDDVAGYRVYRGIGNSAPSAVTSGGCGGLIKQTDCIEADPSPSQSLTYHVRAVDRDASGALREGAASATVTVGTGNRAPATPTIGNAGTYGTIGWYPTTDPDNKDFVDFYRIYRDGTALANRYDVIDNVGSVILWTDPDPGSTQHTYRVAAVDSKLAESPLSNAVTR